MKNFKNSNFHDLISNGRVNLKFDEDSSNLVRFLYTDKETGEVENINTDTMENMEIYVRVILNVQLFCYESINSMIDTSKDIIGDFIDQFKPGMLERDDSDLLVSTNGNIWKGKQITTWIYVDIPYTQNINEINTYINRFVEKYKEICKKEDLDEKDMFSIVKFVAKLKVINNEDSFNLLMISNYQKPNNYVYNSIMHAIVPENIEINMNNYDFKNSGCDVDIENIPGTKDIEIIFDDRVRICEVAIQRFIKKNDKIIIPHFLSRTVNIFKKDKTRPLIKNVNGVIDIGTIGFNIKEHPKSTTFLGEYITKFLTNNGKISHKNIRTISHLFGKVVTNKILNKYVNSEV